MTTLDNPLCVCGARRSAHPVDDPPCDTFTEPAPPRESDRDFDRRAGDQQDQIDRLTNDLTAANLEIERLRHELRTSTKRHGKT